MKTEIRAFDFEVRADENEEHGHFLSGRPIVFGQRTDLGWYDEVIENGALYSICNGIRYNAQGQVVRF